MKQQTTPSSHRPVSIRSLKINTKFQLDPKFMANPRAFARRNGVKLVADIFPETDVRGIKDESRSDKRIKKRKCNIHLVKHGAIRLFAVFEGDDWWVRSIDLSPAKLLYEKKGQPPAMCDLRKSLDTLRYQVTPLLADRSCARYIVPCHVHGEEPVAYWSKVDTEIVFPGIHIRCLHGLSHPDIKPATGARKNPVPFDDDDDDADEEDEDKQEDEHEEETGDAAGSKKDRIQLGDAQDDCLIRIKKPHRQITDPDTKPTVNGIRVRLILQGSPLIKEFRAFGKIAKWNGSMFLAAFSEQDMASVHQAVMARLKGTYLPVPDEWSDRNKGKPLTAAKAMVLVSRITSMPLDEIQAIDEEIRHPSESTLKLLKRDLEIESGRLKPVPVATLFHPAAYASLPPGVEHVGNNIDPEIAAAYGEP